MGKELGEFVLQHAERGACTCGRCKDAPEHPEEHQPDGHTADMIFFKVKARGEPDAGEFKKLISQHAGSFNNIDPLDGTEHNYLELGGWLGDQGLALMFMGLGTLLGLWQLLTPVTMLKLESNEPLARQMANAGMLSIKAPGEA